MKNKYQKGATEEITPADISSDLATRLSENDRISEQSFGLINLFQSRLYRYQRA